MKYLLPHMCVVICVSLAHPMRNEVTCASRAAAQRQHVYFCGSKASKSSTCVHVAAHAPARGLRVRADGAWDRLQRHRSVSAWLRAS
jgi:hypothetical protein